MGGGVELLCLYGSVTGKAESIATQVAKGSLPHALECWRMCLRIKEEYVDLLLCCLGFGQGPTTWLGLFSVLLRRGGDIVPLRVPISLLLGGENLDSGRDKTCSDHLINNWRW